VEAIHVRVPFRRPLLDATGEYTHRRSWLSACCGRAGQGRARRGRAQPDLATDTTAGALAALMREIVPALAEGRLPVWSELAAEGEPGRAAMAAVDGALAAGGSGGATARGRRATPPETIPVSATIVFAGPDAGADAAAQAIELGFETLKLRAGLRARDRPAGRPAASHSRGDWAGASAADRCRGAWDLDTAAERMAAIEPFRIEFVEQPLAAWDVTGHAALRERVRVPIALDESIDSEGSARAALAEGRPT
jgi:L-alanine-DL-glutamate epimerase-like enolase superfamily enzyme